MRFLNVIIDWIFVLIMSGGYVMSNIKTKGKHLALEDRIFIEVALSEKRTLTEIASRLGKDPTTISKEVRRNRFPGNKRNGSDLIPCQHRTQCTKKHICTSACKRICKKCSTINCYRVCPDYTPKKCTKLNRFPYICNRCTTATNCSMERYFYRARVADAKYQEILKSSREGLDLTEGELKKLDELISPLILKGQSIYHICSSHKKDIAFSERTIYKYFEKNAFTAKSIDLPRKVKYKPRKKTGSLAARTAVHRIGRSYEDFIAYTADNQDLSIVEMDTVHGKRGGKVLLTLFFRKSSLMLAFIMDSCTQECVKKVFDDLYEGLGATAFKQSFGVVLTDNGSEFKSHELLEYDSYGYERTKVFYCDPMASHQKARIEKNHEYLRYIFPKGKSLDRFTQEQVTLAINHINNAARASLNGAHPFKLAQMLHDNVLLDKLLLKEIPADEVHLKPALLKK